MKRIRKVSQSIPIKAKVVNSYSESEEETYSCDYVNEHKEIYSTDEIRIGTWINGKPLYRKVYTGTKVSGHNKTFTLSERNIDYVNFYGFITGNQGTTEGAYAFPINYYENSNAFIRANIHRKYMNLTIVSAESPYFNGDYIIVVEYTKTTD